MSLSDLELRGVKLPEKETYFEDLTANQIVKKINFFHERLKRESHLQVAPFAEAYFLNLIALYPVSMCSRNMTGTLKLVAALFYFGSKPTTESGQTVGEDLAAKELFPRNKPSSVHRGYSYEDLALILDRNVPAIVESVRQKAEEARIMLEEAKLRCKSEKAALDEFTEEEKKVLAPQKIEEKRRTNIPC